MSASLSAPSAALIGAFTPEAFAAHLASLPPLPQWWLDRKRAAYARFAALPMPARTDETWRFSNISTVKLEGFAIPGPLSEEARQDILGQGIQSDDYFGFRKIAPTTFVNGHNFGAKHPLPADLAAKGVIVTTLNEAAVKHADLLKAHLLAQPQKLGSEKFASLHTAFISDGAFVYIPKNVEVPDPILITHIASGVGATVFPHTLVIAEDNSKATVVDYFVSDSASEQFAIGANDLYAGHGAQLTYVGTQNWSRETLSFQLNSTIVRRDARVQSLNLHLGARQARHESLSQLQAPGAFSEMLALTIAQGAQEFDQRTLQIHQAPNTKSDLLYKNALLDQSRTIFSGLIVVDPDAQKTDAYQSNRNLMLSDDAEANSLPGLEIQANDVRCTHGATSARIPAEQEFYLQSRGISKAAADELLVFGFFEEVLGRLGNESLHEALSALIAAKLKR